MFEKQYAKIQCDRCGELAYKRALSTRTLMELAKVVEPNDSLEGYAARLANIAKVPKEVALDWASHGMFKMCKEKEVYCHHCGNKLKTWKAKLCVACGEKQ